MATEICHKKHIQKFRFWKISEISNKCAVWNEHIDQILWLVRAVKRHLCNSWYKGFSYTIACVRSCFTKVTWCLHKAFSQLQHSFQLKAVLTLAKSLVTVASCLLVRCVILWYFITYKATIISALKLSLGSNGIPLINGNMNDGY